MNSSITSRESNLTALEVSRMLNAGTSLEQIIKKMRQAGFNKIESIKMLKSVSGLSMADAKKKIHLSPAWQDFRDSDDNFHEQLSKAANQI